MRHKILVADDDEVSRLILCHLLLDAGFDVVEARDGVEAIQCVRLSRPDAVLMDIAMPIMDGCQAAEALKSDSETSTLPIIACTGAGAYWSEWEPLFDAVVKKPFTDSDVLDALQTFLP